jgi:hypothetical protein
MLLISEIELPENADVAAFADFMRDEYMPAVRTLPTRVGQVQGVELVQRATSETTQAFLWLVRWSGLPGGRANVDDDVVRRKFEEFGAAIKDPVEWREVAKVPESGSDG